MRKIKRAAYLNAAFVMCVTLAVKAQPVFDTSVDEQRRALERETQQRQRQEAGTDVHLPSSRQILTKRLPGDEKPCFEIRQLKLQGEKADQFDWMLGYADAHTQLDDPDPVLNRCLGASGVQVVIDRLQNALISRGYVTSRILAQPQDLQGGTLVLTLVPGYVGEIRWAAHDGERASRWNTIPTRMGSVLNLRDIEQALENYKRVPTAEADVQIVPGSEPATSDLIISHKQQMPFRLAATADDSGTRSTGKYQGSLTFSYDNWWTLSDQFYVTFLHDLGGSEPGARGTRGNIVHYSLPIDYWVFSGTQSNNSYHQTVAGANQDYLYSGTSKTIELKLARVIHRDTYSKTSASIKGFQRNSNNYIDDTEVEVQRRVVGGLEWGLNHRQAWGQTNLEVNLGYRVGTGAWGSLPAPEEAFGEGTSHMRLWLADLYIQKPLKFADRQSMWNSQWRAQYNTTPLAPQDRMAIGGRYTVRGFDGENVLSAERGLILRNEISTSISAPLQAYAALDYGRVSGPSASKLVGQSLTGAVIGLRSQGGRLQWDLFVGGPVRKPENFNTSATVAGFSLGFSL